MKFPMNIFMRDENKDSFPNDIHADMSPIYGTRCATQWLLYLTIKDHFDGVQYGSGYPQEGILFIHRSDAESFVWNKDLFVVSLQWDFTVDYRANIHVVSNKFRENKISQNWLSRALAPGFCCYVPPVMHPTITPRDPSRADLFENVVYMGAPRNLDPVFKTDEFKRRVKDLGMNFIIEQDPKKHDDFSTVDVALAVRDIGKLNTVKPAVKLYNAWRGGVPALLGCEIGYREERLGDLDYIEIDSVEDAIQALEKLKSDLKYRHAVIENAVMRGQEYIPEGQQKNWAEFIEEYVYPEYEKWLASSDFTRQLFLLIRWVRYAPRRGLSRFFKKLLGRA